MPLIDKPLAELREYRGLNPRPADFDAYWAQALLELDATDPAPEFVPSTAIRPRHAEAFDLWFTGVGGARIHAMFLRPKPEAGVRHPAVLHFHGYSGHSGDWLDKLAWVQDGFFQRVWEMDLARDAYDGLRRYFRNHDPLHQREREAFTKLGYIDIQHLAPRIRAEVLMFTGLMDTVCPPSAQFAAFNKITAPKDVVIYPDFGHESLPSVADQTLAFFQGSKSTPESAPSRRISFLQLHQEPHEHTLD